MRPIKLTLKGVRSFRNEAVVDFEGLSLAALIGDTGAGKSSLIEALCLALYSSTTWQARGVAELISDGSDRMAVELVFAAGGERWTVTRSHFANTRPAVHKLVSDAGEKVDGARAVDARVETLLGLTRDQFLRAVVMPQGQFEKLLRSTDAERTDILKGVFRLQALSAVRREAAALVSRWKPRADELRGERTGLGDDPRGEHQQAVADLEETERSAAELADLLTKATAAQIAEQEAHQQAEVITQATGPLATAMSGLKPETVAPIQEAAQRLDTEERAASEAHDQAAQAADEAAQRAADALDGFAARDDAVKARAELTQAAEKLTNLDQTRSDAEEALTELDANRPSAEIDTALLTAVEKAAAAKVDAQEAVNAARTHRDEVAALFGRWTAAQETLAAARSAVDAAGADLATRRAEAEETERLVAEAEINATEAADAYLEGTRHDAAAAAAQGCAAGDACPVCDRPLPDDFRPPDAPVLDELTRAKASLEKQHEKAREVHQTAMTELTAAETNLVSVTSQISSASDDLDAAHEALASLLGVAPEVGLTEQSATAGADETLHVASDTLTQADQKHSQAVAAVSAAEATLQAETAKWASERRRVTEQQDTTAKAVSALRDRLAALPPSWRPAVDADGPTLSAIGGRIDAALCQHTSHTADAERHREAQRAASKALAALGAQRSEKVDRPAEHILSATTSAHSALNNLKELLRAPQTLPKPPANGRDLDNIRSFLDELDAAHRALTKAARKAHDRHLVEADRQRDSLTSILAGADQPSVDSLREASAGLRATASHLKGKVEELAGKVARVAEIDAALGVAEPFIANLSALQSLLADGAFVGHLVRERERALLAEASRVLKRLSSNRFGFADGFKVVDLHSGKERDPETLSGGERFQASLGLALALVEIATRGGGQLDAVFIDEGFGSLDTASLDQALSTLSSVASDGKLVVLVSHLRHVAEHVDQVLLVARDHETGSAVAPLDPTERDAFLADDARSRMTG